MKDLNTIPHFEPLDKLTTILMQKTQNNDPLFFRVMIAYYFSKCAASMRTKIKTHDRGVIPVNFYGINLAPSGAGKGYSTNVVEEHVISGFKNTFLKKTFPAVAKRSLAALSAKRSYASGIDINEVEEKTNKEFEALGALLFSFDSATTPAVKQMRHKLLMADAGSVNFELDEIGSNLLSNMEVLTTFLELYDVGKVKQKLIKNTAESIRNEEVEGKTPTNLMLFGTPSTLMIPGSKEEKQFFVMLEAGYARRSFFGYLESIEEDLDISPEESYKRSTDTSMEDYIKNLNVQFEVLADEINFDQTLEMTKEVAVLTHEYDLMCKRQAATLHDYQYILKAELQHRYYKSIKLAGAFAFVDQSAYITADHFLMAAKLAEDSGEALAKILKRPKSHEVLAKYIVQHDNEMTHVDIMEDLPFFSGSETHRKELLNRATAYGYKNNIILQRTYSDNIEFIKGECLKDTDTNKLIISYSDQLAEGYVSETAPFKSLDVLLKMPNMNFSNHQYAGGFRKTCNIIEGFNLVVLDVDEGVKLSTAMMLLKEYSAIFYTTKRHTAQEHRFRIVLPISHEVKLDAEGFKTFMENIYNWLPFQVDTAAKDPTRKWATQPALHGMEYHIQEGKLLDALKFIPNTSAEEKQTKQILEQSSIPSLERWFLLNASNRIGNRNNQLLRYAMVLVDSGFVYEDIENRVKAFNKKLKNPLSIAEIEQTVLKSVHRKFQTP